MTTNTAVCIILCVCCCIVNSSSNAVVLRVYAHIPNIYIYTCLIHRSSPGGAPAKTRSFTLDESRTRAHTTAQPTSRFRAAQAFARINMMAFVNRIHNTHTQKHRNSYTVRAICVYIDSSDVAYTGGLKTECMFIYMYIYLFRRQRRRQMRAL